MKRNFAPKDISLDLNIQSLQIKLEAPIPDTIVIEWARGKSNIIRLKHIEIDKIPSLMLLLLTRILIGLKKTQTREVPVGKIGLLPGTRNTVSVKEGFRITTQLMYDKVANVYESKPVTHYL